MYVRGYVFDFQIQDTGKSSRFWDQKNFPSYQKRFFIVNIYKFQYENWDFKTAIQ